MATTTSPWAQYWFSACVEPIGLRLKVNDMSRAKGLLYAARARLDPAVKSTLAHLSIRTSPASPTDELWIIPEPTAEG